ncbi:twin-arginine translocase subunit, sec-independent protein export (modular protein) [Candidatus Contendobacter odensis Run_B_J11]|uniref:Sec-independent protein translocase protein TatC n=1 Tax=Candidatus Contendobacter odensis Run_B_J11 TaxID=1400861 RepID=A0A7U7GGN8_9GAMM|nr:twin-arginine translocase subunit, sec-independent protein export (modular protein) [Candidatus Contendobacter odensis Run_B_J11]
MASGDAHRPAVTGVEPTAGLRSTPSIRCSTPGAYPGSVAETSDDFGQPTTGCRTTLALPVTCGSGSKLVSDPDREQPFISHLLELRSRLLHIVAGVLAIFLVLTPFSNPIYTLLAGPLLRHMPAQSSMIAIDVLSPFLTPLKLSLMLAVFIAIPWILYQIWGFVAPGLYQREKRLVLPILASSTLLFYCGMAFAYFLIMPLFFAFITSTAPQGVAVMTDINHYLDFVLRMFFAFGMAFEVPVATVILALAGLITPEAMAAKRPYVIVGAFVIGMLLTPPDVISQTLLALPMWLLFEVGVFISRLLLRQRSVEQAAKASE